MTGAPPPSRFSPGWWERVGRLADRLWRLPGMETVRAVLADYERAGGGLLAGGLAYEALFALVPAFLLLGGVVGLLLDPEQARRVVAGVEAVAPPLAPLASAAFEQLRQGAVPLSLVGLGSLAWGASRLYRALDAAIARIFHAAPRRSALARALRGLLSVGVEVGIVVGLVGLAGLAGLLEAAPWPEPARRAWGQLLVVLSSGLVVVALSLVAAAVYRWVPTRRVAWSALGPPAVVVGFVLAVVDHVFAVFGPRLLGVGALVGSMVAVLASLVWLGVTFQVLLLGAVWTRRRLLGATPLGTSNGPEAAGGEEPPSAVGRVEAPRGDGPVG